MEVSLYTYFTQAQVLRTYIKNSLVLGKSINITSLILG
jgi:hypothetical protein